MHTGKLTLAANMYINAIPHYEAKTTAITQQQREKPTLEILTDFRLLADIFLMAAEALIETKAWTSDLIVPETDVVLVPKGQLLEYSMGYYEKARAALQNAVYTLGKVAGLRGATTSDIELQTAKEDLCHLSALMMNVGNLVVDRQIVEEGGKK